MLDLDQLQRLAEEAGSRLPGEEWFDEYELRSILMAHEQDARLISAMSPDTAKKLIAVALAARAVLKETPDEWGAIPKLRKALRELAGSPQERRE